MTNLSTAESLESIINSALSGRRVMARVDLECLLPSISDQASAWIWQAWLSDSPDAMIASLERALSIDPGNTVASAGLIWARQLQNWNAAPEAELELPESADEELSSDGEVLVPQEHEAEPTQGEDTSATPIEPTYRIDSARLPEGEQGTITSGVDEKIGDDLGAFEAVFDDGLRSETPNGGREETTALLAKLSSSRDAADGSEAKLDKLVAEVSAIDDMLAGPMGPHGASARPLVLAIDDSPTVRKLVSMTLERVGYEVVTAADGVAALNLLAERLPVLILSDITMPRIDGYKLCKLIKKHDKTRDIPVVMLSGKNGVFDKVRGQMAGCTDFINKPFESYDLIDKVRQYAMSREPALAEV